MACSSSAYILYGVGPKTDLWLNYDIYRGSGGLNSNSCGRKWPRQMDEGWEDDGHAGQDSLRSSRTDVQALKIWDVVIWSGSNFPARPRRRLLSVWWARFVGSEFRGPVRWRRKCKYFVGKPQNIKIWDEQPLFCL
jgi:hypothetical protein